jgi:hypothetical protein
MKHKSVSLRRLAYLILSSETAVSNGRSTLIAFSVCRKMRPALETLMGTTGFLALLTRALARGSTKAPALRNMKINLAGDLEPLPESMPISKAMEAESNVVLITELLSLLLAFIGTNLTLQVVREIWPELAIYESNFEPG